jgi:glycosyltransferase involved in cell wall biosynthesis
VFLTSKLRLAVRAVQYKLRLLTAYDTFWPAARRGGRLLASGRVGEFTRKLLNETDDARDVETIRRTGPPLFLAGHVLGLGGYDQLVLNVLKGLVESGVNVCRDSRACFRKQLIPLELRPTELRRQRHQPRLAIAPPHLLQRYRLDAQTAAFTMWETDTLPPDSANHLNRCGLVIVPSAWGARSFRAGGVTAPIAVVPLGYDPAVFSPADRPLASLTDDCSVRVTGAEPRPSKPREALSGTSQSSRPGHPSSPARGSPTCTFGTAGALDEGGLRKNVQRVIDLFRRAFPSRDDVRLRVKITPNSPPVTTHGDPRIDVIDAHLAPARLADWYRSLTAYVNASAGEGFGLHLLEAMACGVPLISSTFGGVGAFFDGRVGYEVRFRPVGACNSVYRGMWSDPDDVDIVDRMQRVVRHPEEAGRFGIAAAERARQFRWEDTIRKLVIVLIQNGFISHRRREAAQSHTAAESLS